MKEIEKTNGGGGACACGPLAVLPVQAAESCRSGNLAPDGRKYLDMEMLLRWTYRDELPKAERTFLGNSAGASFVTYGAIIDNNRERDPGFPVALGEPDPDALTVDASVQQLGSVAFDWAESRPHLCAEFIGLVGENDPVLCAMSFDAPALMVAYARMGMRPGIADAAFDIERVLGRNGKPLVDGIDAGGRYKSGSHCTLRYSPDPREVAADRAQYAVWHRLLGALSVQLSESLVRHIPLQPACSSMPWRHPDPQPVIRSNIAERKAFAAKARPRRVRVA